MKIVLKASRTDAEHVSTVEPSIAPEQRSPEECNLLYSTWNTQTQGRRGITCHMSKCEQREQTQDKKFFFRGLALDEVLRLSHKTCTRTCRCTTTGVTKPRNSQTSLHDYRTYPQPRHTIVSKIEQSRSRGAGVDASQAARVHELTLAGTFGLGWAADAAHFLAWGKVRKPFTIIQAFMNTSWRVRRRG